MENNVVKLQDQIREKAYQEILKFLKQSSGIRDENGLCRAEFAVRVLESTILVP